jgi:predicted AAA+ superfamily ATPase
MQIHAMSSELHPEWRDDRRPVFFLDEIQTVPGWEVFARRLLETEKIDLFLSGSSARSLSREVATSMRGRAMEALVHPFSFREYLRYFGREPDRPAGQLAKAVRSALLRDVIERHAVSNPVALRWMVRHLLSNPAGTFC